MKAKTNYVYYVLYCEGGECDSSMSLSAIRRKAKKGQAEGWNMKIVAWKMSEIGELGCEV